MPRTGRPATARAAFDQGQFESMLAVLATRIEVCAWFGFSEESLNRNIRRVYGQKATFEQLAAHFSAKTRVSLRRRVLSKALAEKDGKYDGAMLRYAAERYAGLAAQVVVTRDPAQHDEEMAAQHAAAAAAQSAKAVEAQRVDAVLGLLGAALARR